MMKGSKTIAIALTAFLALGVLGCDSSEEDTGTVSDLNVQVMDGFIMANLMPPVAPDPIACRLTLRVVNTDVDHALSGLAIPSALVFLSKNSQELGTIRFETDWDGLLEAGQADTVRVVKIAESQEIFPPPCNQGVYFRLRIVKTTVQMKQVSTPSYGFSCPVAEVGEER
jgi:hypothetical protein